MAKKNLTTRTPKHLALFKPLADKVLSGWMAAFRNVLIAGEDWQKHAEDILYFGMLNADAPCSESELHFSLTAPNGFLRFKAELLEESSWQVWVLATGSYLDEYGGMVKRKYEHDVHDELGKKIIVTI